MSQGRYEILRPIGAGGMAELYLARVHGDQGFSKLVVLKRILPHLARDTAFVDMFLNEARIAATLSHPNIVSVTDFGKTEGDSFIAMEYVHGADLGAMLETAADRGEFPMDVALTIMLGVCAGLHHAHERRGTDGQPLELVHRDVSPSNVMVSYDGSIKVTDFGIATAGALTRTTRAGTLKGKVAYMSPEQCRGGAVDRRADIFALGILLYEATLLTRLFVGDNDYALMNQVIEGKIVPPREVDRSYPPQLEAIVMRALAPDPADRFPTAAALQSTLEAFAVSHGLHLSTMRVASWMERTMGLRPHPSTELAARAAEATRIAAPPSRRRGGVFVGVGIAAAAIVGAVALTAVARPDPPPPVVEEPPVPEEPAPAPPPKPEIVLVPTPVLMPAQDSAPPTPPEEEELIVLEDEPEGEGRSTSRRSHRTRRKGPRTYDLDEAAPPR